MMARSRKHNIAFLLFFSALFLGCTTLHGQTSPVYDKAWKADSLLPEAFIKRLAFIRNDFEDAFKFRPNGEKTKQGIRQYSLPQAMDILEKEADFDMLFRVQFWCGLDSNYRQAIPALIDRLTDTTWVGLTNAGDVIVWERVKTGELESNPLSYIIKDDIFCVAGRANWILQRITGNDFGRVRIHNDPAYLRDMQKEWLKWLKKLH